MKFCKVFSALKVFSGIALATGALVLSASMNAEAATESENNNTITTADTVAVNEAVTGRCSDKWDDDYYKFTIGNNGCGACSITFWHDNCEADGLDKWYVSLYDSQGYYIKKIFSIESGNAATIYSDVMFDLKKGTYYLSVKPFNSDFYRPDGYWSGVDYKLTFNVIDAGVVPAKIPGLDCAWYTVNGKSYWYEDFERQGTYNDPQGVMGDGTIRGREICDMATNGWYWLDACYNGAKAVGKEVWMPYIYQDEAKWDEITIRNVANESDPGMEQCVLNAILNHTGKWVRYDEKGAMLKGWVTIDGKLATLYPDQVGNTYYYDTRTGLMARGYVTIKGVGHYFDEITGVMQW